MRRLAWKKIIIRTSWILLGIGFMVVLGASMISHSKQSCKNIQVTIESAESGSLFIEEREIRTLLDSTFAIIGQPINQLPLRSMELMLEGNPWIAEAEIFIDKNQLLHAIIRERMPVARLFTIQENSCYIDSNGVRLPLSNRLAARLPVFTDFPSDQPVLSAPDSTLLKNIIAISQFIRSDSFWTAQITQVAILPRNRFELFLLTGTPSVILGDASHLEEKFHKLDAYFRSDYFKMGLGKYAQLNAEYRRQLIGLRRDSLYPKTGIDSVGFYQAVEGIERGALQMKPADGSSTPSHIPLPASTTASNPPSQLILKDKNIKKSYNKVKDSTLSKKAFQKDKKNPSEKTLAGKPAKKPANVPK
jgi:cell division protein FtsQ